MNISIEGISDEMLLQLISRMDSRGGRSMVEAHWTQQSQAQIPPELLSELHQLKSQLIQQSQPQIPPEFLNELAQLKGQIAQMNQQRQLPAAPIDPPRWVQPAAIEPSAAPSVNPRQFVEALARYRTQPNPVPEETQTQAIPVSAVTVLEKSPGIKIENWLRWGPIALMGGMTLIYVGLSQTVLRSSNPAPNSASQMQLNPPPKQAVPPKPGQLLPVPYPPPPPSGGAPLKLPAIPR